jgi:aspartate aminotransferase
MHLAQRMHSIRPSATLAVNAKAQALRAAGKSIVSLAVGEPDFSTPAHVLEAAAAAMREGKTRYTPVPGIPALREAVAASFARYGVRATAEEVIVTNGGKQSLYNLFLALLDPGDEVLLPAPYWVSYPDMIALAQGVAVPVPTEPEQGFVVDLEALDAARTPRTRMLVLNSPCNPTGAHYTQEALGRIAVWAVEQGIFVISDEIYDRLVYAPAQPASLSPWWERHPEGFAIVNGLSKSHAMTGWRVGYTLAHRDLIRAMTKIQGQSTSNICSIAQYAAVAALEGDDGCVEVMRQAFARRRDLAMDLVQTWPKTVCPRPQGAFYLFPRVDALYTPAVPDSSALCAALLDRAGVALVPGAAFGDDRCIRISYAVDDATLERSLLAIGQALALLAS